jgi:hypothetical protein
MDDLMRAIAFVAVQASRGDEHVLVIERDRPGGRAMAVTGVPGEAGQGAQVDADVCRTELGCCTGQAGSKY